MEETPTRRYVEAILEATGLLEKGRLNPKGLEEIGRMDDKKTRDLADGLREQVQDHYERNLPSILEELTKARLVLHACVPNSIFQLLQV